MEEKNQSTVLSVLVSLANEWLMPFLRGRMMGWWLTSDLLLLGLETLM